MANRLKNRVFPEIDYTLHDDIVTQLLAVTVCPITQECSDNNIIFHHQCYDKDAWEKHVRTEQRENRSGVRRGTRRAGDNNRENFSVTEALRKVYEVIDRRKMRLLIEKRVDIRPREWQRFAPNTSSVTVNEFSAYLISLGEMSKERRGLYEDYIANRRSVADVNPQTKSSPSTAVVQDGSVDANDTLPTESTTTSNESAPPSDASNSNKPPPPSDTSDSRRPFPRPKYPIFVKHPLTPIQSLRTTHTLRSTHP